MPTKTVSGVAVAVAATGGVLIWSGLNNSPLLETLRSLAKGEAPTPHRNPPFQPISGGGTTGTGPATGGSDNAIVAEAQKWLGTKYVFGGCHGCTSCHPGQGVDCSSFVTWVMKATGHYKGKCSMVAGSSMLAWGMKISKESRGPGDVVLWPGSHCGIIVDNTRMINAPHTGTVVRYDTYSNRSGWVVLRAPSIISTSRPDLQ